MLPPVLTIKKDTLEKTYEHVNKALKQEYGEDIDKVKTIIECDEKLNVFEKKVQAIFIDSLKVKEGVIKCLLSDDLHLVRRVLKCDWFFEDAVSPEFYENNIFPNVSYSTRCKIINQLSRNIKSNEHAEELFQIVKRNYGSQYAEMFLPRCSLKFVSAFMQESKPSFRNRNSIKNLINICKRYPNVVVSFLRNECAHGNSLYDFSKVILYLSKNFPLVFIDFYSQCYKHLTFFRFGKKFTKSFAAELMQLARESSGRLLRGSVNNRVLFQRLDFEDQIELLQLIFENSGEEISYLISAFSEVIPLLKLKPPNERFRMMEIVIYKLCGWNLGNHPELWSPKLLETLPLDCRSNLVEQLLKKTDEDLLKYLKHSEFDDSERNVKDIFIYLLSCKEAYPLLTELMNKMSTPKMRGFILREMVQNCIINNDPEGLESVLKYILKRHRNERPQVMVNLILRNFENRPEIMNSKIWELVEQLTTLTLVNTNSYFVYEKIIENYIYFKLKNNLDVRPQVKNMIKLNFVPSPYSNGLIQKVEKSYGEALIMLYYNEIYSGSADLAEEEIQEKLTCLLLRTINSYNSSVKRTKIKIENLPLLEERIEIMMKKPDYIEENQYFVADVLKNRYLRNKYADRMLQISLKPGMLQYLLKRHPEYVEDSLENILDSLCNLHDAGEFRRFFTSRCRLDFSNLTPKIEKILSEKFKTCGKPEAKRNALWMYSLVADLGNFTELVNGYVPNEDRMNLASETEDFRKIQIFVPQVIKNIKPDSRNFELISKYLSSDFFKWVQPSYYSACHNSASNKVLPVLMEDFLDKPASVRKVLLDCFMDLSPIEGRMKHCRMLWSKRMFPSERAVLFLAVSKCFEENPTKENFEMVKTCLLESDETTIKSRPSLHVVPEEFLNEYTTILWKLTENQESRSFILNCQNEVIRFFSSSKISILKRTFCEMIIRLYLFVEHARVNVTDFSCNYTVHHPHPTHEKISFILELLRERRYNCGSVESYITHLRGMTMEDPNLLFAIMDAILPKWLEIYDNGKMFNVYLQLLYAKGYSKALKKCDLNESAAAGFGKELRRIVNAIPLYSYFVETIKCTLEIFLNSLPDFDRPTLLENFLGSSFNHVDAIIAIGLIPQAALNSLRSDASCFVHQRSGCQYDRLFETLLKKNDDIIKIHLNLRMGNMLPELDPVVESA